MEFTKVVPTKQEYVEPRIADEASLEDATLTMLSGEIIRIVPL